MSEAISAALDAVEKHTDSKIIHAVFMRQDSRLKAARSDPKWNPIAWDAFINPERYQRIPGGSCRKDVYVRYDRSNGFRASVMIDADEVERIRRFYASPSNVA